MWWFRYKIFDSLSTGSTPAKGDALVNSVPKVTGDPVKDLSDTTYNATLNIVDTKEDTDFTDDFLKSYGETGTGTTREELITEAENNPLNIILTITKNTEGNNIVTLSKPSPASGEEPYLKDAELKKDSSGKYNAGVEKTVEYGTEVYYIEFDTTTIKYVIASSQNFGGGDIGSKYTYTGTLTKQAN